MTDNLEELRKENDRLKQELDTIDLTKAKKEQEDLKTRLEDKKRMELEEHDKTLIAKVKTELGIGVESKAPPEDKKSMNLVTSKTEAVNYMNDYASRQQKQGRDIKGRTYEETIEMLMARKAIA